VSLIIEGSVEVHRTSLDPETTNNPVDDLLGTAVLGVLAGHESGTGSKSTHRNG
jgi:hypothetical protein